MRPVGALLLLASQLCACNSCEPPSTKSSASASDTSSAKKRPRRESMKAPTTEPDAVEQDKKDASERAAKVREAMASMKDLPPEARQAFAGAAIAEQSQGKIIEPLRLTFDELQRTPPDAYQVVLMKVFGNTQVAAAFKKVCPAGVAALAEMVKLPRAETGRYLVKQCQFKDTRLISEADAEQTDGLALAAAELAAAQLGDADVERELLVFFLQASRTPSG